MSISDSIMSIIPEQYRRDAVVLGLGLALGSGWWHFETRIDTAYAAATATPTLQQQISKMQADEAVISAQTATNQSNIVGTKAEVDMIYQHLLGQQPVPTAQPVPTPRTPSHP